MTRSGMPATGLAAARDADIPDVLGLLEQSGCVLCRTCEDATRTWTRWFSMENNNDPALLDTLERSAGFCPAHTRRLLTETSVRILRSALASALSGAIRRAEQAAARLGWDKPRRLHRATVPCPLCRVTVERVRAAAGDLAAYLDRPQVAAAIRDRGGLCFRHLRHLLPKLSSTQAVSVADAVASRLSALPAGTPESRFLLAGHDPDALARIPYLEAHALILDQESGGSLGRTFPAAQSPADRLMTDLAYGSCPICRAAGREQIRYLLWLGQHRPECGPAANDLRVCPRHLHDTQSAPGASAQALSSSAAAAAEQALGLAAGATALTAGQPCRACRAGLDAERRQLSLLRASLLDARVLRALEDAHGLCLRHAAEVTEDRDAGPVISRLLTQLRQVQWELAEDAAKQAWDRRHEPRGAERDAWRRVPALIDGEVYLGAAARSSKPTA